MTRHSRCKDFEIARIGTSHTTVTQQAEQVRIVTGQWTTQKDDGIRKKIVWTELHVESLITITIRNWQWISILIWRSNLHCYRATIAIDNQYDGEVIDRATKFQKREIAMSTQSSPTDKSKAHLEAVCRDTHRQVYPEVLLTSDEYAKRQVYQVDQDSTEAAYREQPWSWPDGHWSGLPKMITKSMPLTDDYRLHDIFYRSMRKHCTELRQC